MKKESFLKLLVELVAKNMKSSANEYFLVCNDTNELYNPICIYSRVVNNEVLFDIELNNLFYSGKTLEQLFKWFEVFGLININDTLKFYNVSLLKA